MPRFTTNDIIASAWNSLHNPTQEESEKFLEIFKKVLTNNN